MQDTTFTWMLTFMGFPTLILQWNGDVPGDCSLYSHFFPLWLAVNAPLFFKGGASEAARLRFNLTLVLSPAGHSQLLAGQDLHWEEVGAGRCFSRLINPAAYGVSESCIQCQGDWGWCCLILTKKSMQHSFVMGAKVSVASSCSLWHCLLLIRECQDLMHKSASSDPIREVARILERSQK